MLFSVPLTFEYGCRVNVDADNPHEAIRKALEEYNNPINLMLCEPEYVEDSVRPAYGVETVNDVYPVQ